MATLGHILSCLQSVDAVYLPSLLTLLISPHFLFSPFLKISEKSKQVIASHLDKKDRTSSNTLKAEQVEHFLVMVFLHSPNWLNLQTTFNLLYYYQGLVWINCRFLTISCFTKFTFLQSKFDDELRLMHGEIYQMLQHCCHGADGNSNLPDYSYLLATIDQVLSSSITPSMYYWYYSHTFINF